MLSDLFAQDHRLLPQFRQGRAVVAALRSLLLPASLQAGVRQHFPGEPKPSYVTPWDDTPEWERQAAGSVYAQVHQFLELSGGQAARLSREQKGRFVATCWTAQIFKHFENPKPSYVADWQDLPGWQKETDADIFEAIEKSLS